jgi:predicted nucleic acid-binding protein
VALSYLVDTSVLTRLSTPSVRAALEGHVEAGAVGRLGITNLEIGSSARNEEEWDTLIRALTPFPLIDVTEEHVVRARWVQRQLAERGLRGRKLPDLLIAAAAEQQGLIVLHYESDFDHIAGVTGQEVEWITPKGAAA